MRTVSTFLTVGGLVAAQPAQALNRVTQDEHCPRNGMSEVILAQVKHARWCFRGLCANPDFKNSPLRSPTPGDHRFGSSSVK
jgi:hypothetical protein